MVCATLTTERGTLASLRGSWDELALRTPGASVFLTSTWHETWWKHFGVESTQHVLSVHDDGRIVAIAPLMQSDGKITFMGSTDLVDYHDFLAVNDDHERVAGAVLESLLEIPGWESLHFESVPEWSPLWESLPEAGGRLGLSFQVEVEDVAPYVPLAREWEQYVSGLGKKDRHELRRKLRRLDAAGSVEHQEMTEPAQVIDHLDRFFPLHRMSDGEKGEFMTAEREEFFRDVIARLAAEGSARLNFTRVDGQDVATSVAFEMCGTRFVYNSGYDPALGRLSVGLANHAFFLKQCIEDGIGSADFMRGDERYKYDLGGVDRAIYTLSATRTSA